MEETHSAVKSADRTLIVLEHLAAVRSSQTLNEIADALGIPKSSLHGLLRTMQSRNWLSVDERSEGVRYQIGPRALTVGSTYLVNDDILRRSIPFLDSLVEEVGETVHLGVLEGPEIMYVAKRDARHSLRLVSDVGVRLPAFATALGKALLAELDEATLSETLTLPRKALTSHSLIDESALRADLNATRDRGYAIDDQESTEGVRCFAVTLRTGLPAHHAISCSTPIVRLDRDTEFSIVAALKATAEQFAGVFSR